VSPVGATMPVLPKLLRNMESHGHDQLLPHALPLFAEMKTEGIPPDVVTYNTFIDMYCKEGMNGQIPVPDIISYSALLDGYCLRVWKVDRALGLLQEMPLKGLYPNAVTYSTLIDAWCKDKRLTYAKKLFKEMKANGLKPNVVTLSSLLDGLCKNKKIDEVMQTVREMENNGVVPNIITYNILMMVSMKMSDSKRRHMSFLFLAIR
ncbi:hypothetical protein RDABS01_031755, partial [Bienertia sinuspersici]